MLRSNSELPAGWFPVAPGLRWRKALPGGDYASVTLDTDPPQSAPGEAREDWFFVHVYLMGRAVVDGRRSSFAAAIAEAELIPEVHNAKADIRTGKPGPVSDPGRLGRADARPLLALRA
jgi:hypothetical protein